MLTQIQISGEKCLGEMINIFGEPARGILCLSGIESDSIAKPV